MPGSAGRPRTCGWPVPARTLAGAAAGVAVRRILGRLSVSWDVASLLPGEHWSPVPLRRYLVAVPMSKASRPGFTA